MKRSFKLVVCMLLVATIALPSVFATGLGTSSSLVKVGTVDTTDVNYNVNIEWGSLIYNFVKSENGEYYEWEPESEGSNVIIITNESNVMVNANILFTSAIYGVNGEMNEDESYISCVSFYPLNEEPEDFKTAEYPTYFKKDSNGLYVEVTSEDVFKAGEYYIGTHGFGPFPATGDIPAGITTGYNEFTGTNGTYDGNAVGYYVLDLYGGDLSTVRPGATIGTVTVTLS